MQNIKLARQKVFNLLSNRLDKILSFLSIIPLYVIHSGFKFVFDQDISDAEEALDRNSSLTNNLAAYATVCTAVAGYMIGKYIIQGKEQHNTSPSENANYAQSTRKLFFRKELLTDKSISPLGSKNREQASEKLKNKRLNKVLLQ